MVERGERVDPSPVTAFEFGYVGGDGVEQRVPLEEVGPVAFEAVHSWRDPSAPHKTFPDTPHYGATRPAQVREQSNDRHERSARWFAINRRGGNVLLRHRHIRPVLVREWDTPMDGIAGAIWASRSLALP